MSTIKILKDKHGFYIRRKGKIARPVDEYDYTDAVVQRCNWPFTLDVVDVKIDGVWHHWKSHGSYIVPDGNGVKHLKSTDVFNG